MRFEPSSEGEASSAEEQLASNSLMQDDNRGSSYGLPLVIIGLLHGLKNLFRFSWFLKCKYHLMKFFLASNLSPPV